MTLTGFKGDCEGDRREFGQRHQNSRQAVAVGYVLYVRGPMGPASAGTLMAQPIDTHDWRLSGEAVPIVERVFAGSCSASEDGTLVYTHGGLSTPNLGVLPGLIHGQLTWVDRKGNALRKVGEPGWYRIPALSPDENKIALEVVDPQVTTQPSFETKGAARELFPVPVGVLFFDVSKDGRKFLMPLPTGSDAGQSPFQMVLNWTAMLKK